jgi:hypothetical protein
MRDRFAGSTIWVSIAAAAVVPLSNTQTSAQAPAVSIAAPAPAQLTVDAIMAQTLCENLESIRTMEAMIVMAERRRNDVLCQIERHRVTLPHRTRQAVQQLDGEDCQIVNSNPTQPKSAA